MTNLTPHIGAWANLTAIGLGLVLLAGGGLMAYRSRSISDRRGGRGGEAVVRGADSNAAGGAGGTQGMYKEGAEAMQKCTAIVQRRPVGGAVTANPGR